MAHGRPSDSYWSKDAADFSSLYGSRPFTARRLVSGFLEARSRRLLELADFSPASDLLDVGSGPGIHMVAFAGRCRTITGVDFSPSMIEAARQRLALLAAANWSLQQADARALPFAPASFDGIIAMGLLDYVDPVSVLREARRVLRPGGRIVFTIPKRPSLFAVLRTRPGNWVRRHVLRLPPIGFSATRTQVNSSLAETGFRLVHLEALYTTMWMVKATAVGP